MKLANLILKTNEKIRKNNNKIKTYKYMYVYQILSSFCRHNNFFLNFVEVDLTLTFCISEID